MNLAGAIKIIGLPLPLRRRELGCLCSQRGAGNGRGGTTKEPLCLPLQPQPTPCVRGLSTNTGLFDFSDVDVFLAGSRRLLYAKGQTW